MELNSASFRAFIKSIIKESLGNISEAQKGDRVDLNLDNWVGNLEILFPEGKYNTDQIKNELKKEINIKINKVMRSNFKFSDFIILPLGDFKVKTNEGEDLLTFSKSDEKYNISFPYVFVYQDTIQVLRFGSRTFTNLQKEAEAYIKNHKINLNTLSETGNKIVQDNTFDTTNYIDMVDWSQVNRPELTKKEPRLAKEKRSYRPGQKIKHDKYGKGEIQASKKVGTDEFGNDIFNVTVVFDFSPEQNKILSNPTLSEKDRLAIIKKEMDKNTKVLRMKTKQLA